MVDEDKPLLDKYGNELVYLIELKNRPNRAERRKAGIRNPLWLIEQHRDLMESMVAMADEGVEEIGAEPSVEEV